MQFFKMEYFFKNYFISFRPNGQNQKFECSSNFEGACSAAAERFGKSMHCSLPESVGPDQHNFLSLFKRPEEYERENSALVGNGLSRHGALQYKEMSYWIDPTVKQL